MMEDIPIAPSGPRATVPPLRLEQLAGCSPLNILVLPDLHVPFGRRQKECLLSHRSFLDSFDWVVLLGDICACYGTRGEYAAIDPFIGALNRPYSAVNGNHEFAFSLHEDASPLYGKEWTPSSPEESATQLSRFERFYGNLPRFQAVRHPSAGIVQIGVDGTDALDRASLTEANDAWLCSVLAAYADAPVLVFCHYPLLTDSIRELVVHSSARTPGLMVSETVADLLRRRTLPLFWLSGHLHVLNSHSMSDPYLTKEGVWQCHCPDGWGFGRPDFSQWDPVHYTGLEVCGLRLSSRSLKMTTYDLWNDSVLRRVAFTLDAT